jgi:hypothetical protein
MSTLGSSQRSVPVARSYTPMKEWSPRVLRNARRLPDLAALQVDHLLPIGGDPWIVAFRELSGRVAGKRSDPDGLVHSAGEVRGIRRRAVHFEVAAANVNDGAPVRRPGELVDLLAVVLVVRGEAAALVAGRLGDPDIAQAALVHYPCDGAPRRCGSQGAGKRSAEDLLEREWGACRGGKERKNSAREYRMAEGHPNGYTRGRMPAIRRARAPASGPQNATLGTVRAPGSVVK